MKKYSVVIVLAFVWAAYYYSLGISNKQISPFATGVFIRFFTFIILTAVMAAGGRIKQLKVEKRFVPRLALIGCMGFLLDITAFVGSRYGNPATGSILLKTDVIMIGIMSAVLYKQKLSGKEWTLVGIMLAGVSLVLGIQPGNISFHPTDICFLLSAFFVSVNAFLIKSVQRWGIPNNVIAYYNNFVTMIFFCGATAMAGAGGDLRASFGSLPLLTALAVGALGQFFVYIFYYRALQTLPVWNVKVVLLLIPIITLFYDFIFAGKTPSPTMLLGTVIVLTSAYLVIKIQSKKDDGSRADETKECDNRISAGSGR